MKYSELEIKAMKDELASTEALLASVSLGEPVQPDPAAKLTEEDTDRAKAEQENRLAVENMSVQRDSAGACGMDYAVLQEDQRVRRDARIARQGHKRLMLGCLETAYRRMLKLRKETASAT